MFAVSFVGTVDAVGTQVRRPQRLSTCDPTDAARVHATACGAMDALLDLARQFACGVPLPTLETQPAEDVDAAVSQICDSLTASNEVPIDQLQVATAAGRAHRIAGRVVVPLERTGPAAANWYVVLWWVHDRLGALAEECSITLARLRAFGYERLVGAFDALEDMVVTFRQAVASLLTEKTWLDPPDGLLESDVDRLHRTASRLVERLEDTS